MAVSLVALRDAKELEQDGGFAVCLAAGASESLWPALRTLPPTGSPFPVSIQEFLLCLVYPVLYCLTVVS